MNAISYHIENLKKNVIIYGVLFGTSSEYNNIVEGDFTMADIINSLRDVDVKKRRKLIKSRAFSKEDKILFFIIMFSIAVITIDYCLIIKFINIIKNI